jgi:4-alpha-glucanotransferase
MATSGILLHISSLPNGYGIGSLGQTAYDFIDFLKKSNQKIWQVLPIGPTSFGDSPYQTLSRFAGNHYFIDLEFLCHDGLLQLKEVRELKTKEQTINYHELFITRLPILRLAYSRFDKTSKAFQLFLEEEASWLPDYALYMSIKEVMQGKSWNEWDDEYRRRDKTTLRKFAKDHRNDIEFWYFVQFKFFQQWRQLHQYAKKNHIKIMGDVPIYVAYDSADVWTNPEYYELDETLTPTWIAGVPPDAFSEDGQRWGNPLYRYDVMAKDRYAWWRRRVSHALALFDIIRIDHFRGFEAYYAIPSHEATARNGKWIKGPGMSLWSEILKENSNANIIAENLGFLTPEVDELLKACNFPGMKVLEFTLFSDNPTDDIKTFPKYQVVYPGTHDNPPLKAWLATLTKKNRESLYHRLNVTTNEEAIDAIIDLALHSKCQMVIVSMQDYLHLGAASRLNTPGTTEGNWTWRMQKRSLNEILSTQIARITKQSKR